jgi:hypothetical protein
VISVRRAIADAIAALGGDGFYGHPYPAHIKGVQVRRGCAEIEVEYELTDVDAPDYATIDAAPVLTALLQIVIDQEAHDEAVSRIKASEGTD